MLELSLKMEYIKRTFDIIGVFAMKLLFSALLLIVLTAFSARADGLKAKTDIPLTEDVSFNYAFVEKPKVGDVIMKIKLSQPADSIQAFAEYDMPSMRGHHASGKVAFKRNRAGDFVLPIHFAMPGDWEIKLTFEQDGKELFAGAVELDI